MITIPAALFGLVIALLIGALYHVLRGGNGWRLLLFLGLSALGFAAGQAGGWGFGWVVYKFGLLDLGLGVIGSVVFILLGDWLSRPRPAA